MSTNPTRGNSAPRRQARGPKRAAQIHEVDVLIVGAGISGIGLACRLTQRQPRLRYRIVERRERIGGTWDLFRYPGIRSDSDMFTFGYDFKPWTDSRVLADGEAIRGYLQETAEDYQLSDRIDFGVHVTSADWSSVTQRWTVVAEDGNGGPITYVAKFYVGCTGYYNYDQGYRPEFPDEDTFDGDIIHPQHWPEDLDYSGKRVAVIGSGATAVTLVPNMARTAGHVTMIQRSPTYIVPLAAENQLMIRLQKHLSPHAVYRIIRWVTMVLGRVSFSLMRTFPKTVKSALLKLVAKRLNDDIDIKHFTPDYDPWDQRMCVVPDGDLFDALNEGSASIVTDTIERFTSSGIQLGSGAHVDADIIVTATGLDVLFNGGIDLTVDAEPVQVSARLTYKAVLIEGIPNAALIFGYTNASWTLKVDIAADYVCRLLSYMDEHGYGAVVAHADGNEQSDGTIFGNLTSGYVRRAADRLPRQGRRGVWKVKHDYLADYRMLRRAPIADPHLEFAPRLVASTAPSTDPTPPASSTVTATADRTTVL
ncbi:flavin-containing monooxygenase [Gordonia alkanivorans]|uniref:FAD-containing monooxygenase EthA n=1 Tax=Gordonia alkanivorans NBRC 16433 TaxID=1027371 RepID=F9W249_9ACTN|nr:NAD(P)/FAD-dependent oxidoreductase [Gordonia alkanivorans]GAA14909.1 putative monooxygenase [Gordonia alkanivorans NBRC 16433]